MDLNWRKIVEPLERFTGFTNPKIERGGYSVDRSDMTRAETLDEAELLSSRIYREDQPGPAEKAILGDSPKHKVLLDIDLPCSLIESTTPGHYHLYIDKTLEWGRYERLLTVLADCGILEQGYVEASRARRETNLRTPWTKKSEDEAPKPAPDFERAAVGGSIQGPSRSPDSVPSFLYGGSVF